MTDFTGTLSIEDKNKVSSSIKIIREYFKSNENLKEDIKMNNEAIKGEVDSILKPTLGGDVAKILLKHIKDSELKETMQEELATIKLLEGEVYE